MADQRAAELSVAVRETDRCIAVALGGELDVSTAGQVRDALCRFDLEAGNDMHVDLSALEFIDSSGMGVLVNASRRVRASGGDFSMVSDGDVLRALRIAGLVEYLGVRPGDGTAR